MKFRCAIGLQLLVGSFGALASSAAHAIDFERIVIDDKFPGAYQVEVADVNGDGKPDVVAVGGGTCAWYENPSWKKRLVSTPKETPAIISSASRDIDGDGKAEVAIAYDFAMNEPKRGKLLLAAQGKNLDDPWTYTEVGKIPSIHRLRWGDTEGDGKPDLVVAPIFGEESKPPVFDQDSARIRIFGTLKSADPRKWTVFTSFPRLPVLHAIDVIDLDGTGQTEILGASNHGVTAVFRSSPRSRPGGKIEAIECRFATGAPGVSPKKGSSEVHVGRLKDGRRVLTTVEPWHGTDVAVYLSEGKTAEKFGPRTVIDSSLKDGHALWVADVDGDGDDEIFAGYRGTGTSVLMFDFNGKTWEKTVIDSRIAAQDLRGGDLDGDGTPDVVAVGGSTHNVVWYRPKRVSGAGRD
jgi:hypothetical protein